MKLIIGLLASVLFTSVCAEENPAVVSDLKVDLQQAVAAGNVRPVDGLSSAGMPDEAALRVFSNSGYVAVIDLRSANEIASADEAPLVRELGMDYVSLPVTGPGDISYDKARELDALLDRYNGPVLIHCGSGNRVGALLALRESLRGADKDYALAVGRAGGLTGLDAVVQERLEENPRVEADPK
jgi:uncharacterized protein (TIGR01244 family)